MNNRDQKITNQSALQTSAEQKHNTFQDNLARAAAQTVTTTLAIGTLGFPLDYYVSRKTLGMPITFGTFFSVGFLTANSKTLVPSLSKAYQMGFMKNVAVSNHGRVSETVSEVLPETEGKQKNYMGPIFASTLIAGGDTLATQPFINPKILLDAGIQKPSYTFAQALKFGKIGMGTRFTANYLNAVCCVGAVSILRDPIDNILPPDKFGCSSAVITTILAGCISGSGSHALKVVNSNRIKQVHLPTQTAPSFGKVLVNLVSERGPQVLVKGALPAMGITVGAFGIINSVDYLFNNYPDAMIGLVQSPIKPVLAGSAVGVGFNAFKNLLENRLDAIDMVNLTTPNLRATLAQTLAKEGPRFALRGAGPAVGFTAAAFTAAAASYGGVEFVYDKMQQLRKRAAVKQTQAKAVNDAVSAPPAAITAPPVAIPTPPAVTIAQPSQPVTQAEPSKALIVSPATLFGGKPQEKDAIIPVAPKQQSKSP